MRNLKLSVSALCKVDVMVVAFKSVARLEGLITHEGWLVRMGESGQSDRGVMQGQALALRVDQGLAQSRRRIDTNSAGL